MDTALIEAIDKTISLHMKVIDGKVDDFIDAKLKFNANYCPLCLFVIHQNKTFRDCGKCPWMEIEGMICDINLYNDSPKSIIRLNRWKRIIKKR